MAGILVAEHNKTIAEYIRAALKKSGHAVTLVDNSLDAWRASARGGYDALLIDAIMPGVDGFVLAQRALQENPMLHVVFLTGIAAVAMDTISTPSYAPAPMTTKPFHIREIGMRLRALMSNGAWYYDSPAQKSAGTVIYADFAKKADTAKMAQF
jgi:DNA-binding response OmpR family regulator